jgi:hypothetical protein
MGIEFRDKPNQEALEKKRDEYILQAIHEMKGDKDFISSLKTNEFDDLRIFNLMFQNVKDKIWEAHHVSESSPDSLKEEMENEYPQKIIENLIERTISNREDIGRTLIDEK